MRVTAETKSKTRQLLLKVAHNLFNKKGFNETTTRDIATAAGVAAGTLFNYFPTKEGLAMTLIAEAMDGEPAATDNAEPAPATLDEALFSHIAAVLRSLEPFRPYVGDVFGATLSPFAGRNSDASADQFRAAQLSNVEQTMRDFQVADASPLALHLYWTLFLGVVAFWSTDDSPKQEDTLAFMDMTLQLFVASLTNDADPEFEVLDERTIG